MSAHAREDLAASHTRLATIDFLSGCVGGTVNVYVGQPLDTVKSKMQAFPSVYRNGWDCFRRTLVKQGVYRGLYSGSVPNLAANISENAVLFMAYGRCQSALAGLTGKSSVDQLGTLENACSGGLAAVFSSMVLCPTELVKLRLQTASEVTASTSAAVMGTDRLTKVGPVGMTRMVYQEHGLRGFYRGISATLLKEVPGYFFFFGGYEGTRWFFCQKGKSKDDIGILRTMLAGGVGGISFWLSVYPADVIKSRIQIMNTRVSSSQLFWNIVKNEGVSKLYAGIGPTLLRTFFATGVLFLAYEQTKRGLSQILL